MTRRDIVVASLVSLMIAGGALGRIWLRHSSAEGRAGRPASSQETSTEVSEHRHVDGEGGPAASRSSTVANASAPTRAPAAQGAAPSQAAVAQYSSNHVSHSSAPRAPGRESNPGGEVHKVSAGRWISEYRQAVCECSTRTCVRDVQGRFLSSRVDYDAQRDEETYTEGAREALRCYFALPEGS